MSSSKVKAAKSYTKRVRTSNVAKFHMTDTDRRIEMPATSKYERELLRQERDQTKNRKKAKQQQSTTEDPDSHIETSDVSMLYS